MHPAALGFSLAFAWYNQSQDLRGAYSNRAFDPMEARLACGSVVLFSFFAKKMESYALPEAIIRFQMSDRVMRVSQRRHTLCHFVRMSHSMPRVPLQS
jgi:hypothetical protein